MKIIIEFNKALGLTYKEKMRLIDREDFNERLKTVLDNGEGLKVENPFGQWVYKIKLAKNKIKKKG